MFATPSSCRILPFGSWTMGVDRSVRTSESLVRESHRPRAAHVSRLQTLDSKAGLLNQRRNWPVQMAATSDVLPHRREPILPTRDGGGRRPAMLDEQETP